MSLIARELVYRLKDLPLLDATTRENLIAACELHRDGYADDYNETILTCWDANRPDLGRVGITPHPSRLCTEACA